MSQWDGKGVASRTKLVHRLQGHSVLLDSFIPKLGCTFTLVLSCALRRVLLGFLSFTPLGDCHLNLIWHHRKLNCFHYISYAIEWLTLLWVLEFSFELIKYMFNVTIEVWRWSRDGESTDLVVAFALRHTFVMPMRLLAFALSGSTSCITVCAICHSFWVTFLSFQSWCQPLWCFLHNGLLLYSVRLSTIRLKSVSTTTWNTTHR